MVLLKESFKKVDFEKNQQTTNNIQNYPEGKGFIKDLMLYITYRDLTVPLPGLIVIISPGQLISKLRSLSCLLEI